MTQGENSSDFGQPSPDNLPDLNAGDQNAPDARPSAAPSPPAWTGCRYSMKAYRFRAICLFLVSALILAAAAYVDRLFGQQACGRWIFRGALVLVLVLWVSLVVQMLYRHYTISYKLDRDRLLMTHGFFRQTTDTVLIAQIDDITKVQTLADRLFNGGVGTIEIYANDRSGGHVFLEGVDLPQKAFESLDLLRKDYVRRRGIKPFVSIDHGVDVGGTDSFFE